MDFIGKVRATLVIILGLVVAGCTGFEPHPEVLPLEAGTVISETASTRNIFVHDRASNLFICSEPPPDAGFSQDSGTSFSLTLINTGSKEGEGEEEGSAEVEFTGRSPSVLLARELLYRLCEFTRNNNIDQATAVELYRANLAIIEKVSAAVAANTTITIGDSVKDSVMTNQSAQSNAVNALPSVNPAPPVNSPASAADNTESNQ